MALAAAFVQLGSLIGIIVEDSQGMEMECNLAFWELEGGGFYKVLSALFIFSASYGILNLKHKLELSGLYHLMLYQPPGKHLLEDMSTLNSQGTVARGVRGVRCTVLRSATYDARF